MVRVRRRPAAADAVNVETYLASVVRCRNLMPVAVPEYPGRHQAKSPSCVACRRTNSDPPDAPVYSAYNWRRLSVYRPLPRCRRCCPVGRSAVDPGSEREGRRFQVGRVRDVDCAGDTIEGEGLSGHARAEDDAVHKRAVVAADRVVGIAVGVVQADKAGRIGRAGHIEPSPVLPLMTLRAPAAVPPMVLPTGVHDDARRPSVAEGGGAGGVRCRCSCPRPRCRSCRCR